jgi:hypothetical protein
MLRKQTVRSGTNKGNPMEQQHKDGPSDDAVCQPRPEWPEWMDLKMLERYASVSNRTLRSWIKDSENPLPASARGGKLFVSRRVFDEWMKGHTVEPVSIDVERTVNDILKSL